MFTCTGSYFHPDGLIKCGRFFFFLLYLWNSNKYCWTTLWAIARFYTEHCDMNLWAVCVPLCCRYSGHAVQSLVEFKTSGALQWLSMTGPPSLLERTGLAQAVREGRSFQSSKITNITIGGKPGSRCSPPKHPTEDSQGDLVASGFKVSSGTLCCASLPPSHFLWTVPS